MALVGGMNFTTQQLNFASDAPISPGSSIKPYSYATLINDNNNVGAGSMIVDNKAPLPGYPAPMGIRRKAATRVTVCSMILAGTMVMSRCATHSAAH
ncbi:MAG: hypothetical protein WDN27_05990 [Candidatus Saccharibacteria bacterium]